MTTIDDIASIVCRHGDADVRSTVRQLVHEHGPDAALRLLTAPDDPNPVPRPARLSIRLLDLLEQHGGSITQPHLVRYLADVLQATDDAVRHCILDEEHAGTVDLAWADATDDRFTLTIVRGRT